LVTNRRVRPRREWFNFVGKRLHHSKRIHQRVDRTYTSDRSYPIGEIFNL